MKLYKITDKSGYTRRNQEGETLWGENVTHKAGARGKKLCTNQVIHCYKDPYLAVFMNPEHGNYDTKTMLLWEARGRIVADDGTKLGCKTLTTIKQIPVPKITTEQLIEIATKCATKVYSDEKFQKWALNWVSGKNRTRAAWVSGKNRTRAAAAAMASAAMASAAEAAWAAGAAARALASFDIVSIIHEGIEK